MKLRDLNTSPHRGPRIRSANAPWRTIGSRHRHQLSLRCRLSQRFHNERCNSVFFCKKQSVHRHVTDARYKVRINHTSLRGVAHAPPRERAALAHRPRDLHGVPTVRQQKPALRHRTRTNAGATPAPAADVLEVAPTSPVLAPTTAQRSWLPETTCLQPRGPKPPSVLDCLDVQARGMLSPFLVVHVAHEEVGHHAPTSFPAHPCSRTLQREPKAPDREQAPRWWPRCQGELSSARQALDCPQQREHEAFVDKS